MDHDIYSKADIRTRTILHGSGVIIRMHTYNKSRLALSRYSSTLRSYVNSCCGTPGTSYGLLCTSTWRLYLVPNKLHRCFLYSYCCCCDLLKALLLLLLLLLCQGHIAAAETRRPGYARSVSNEATQTALAPVEVYKWCRMHIIVR